MGVLGQVSFFVALIVAILVHESAHFTVAKAFKIKVTEFFVGFGPRVWSTRRGETEYGVKPPWERALVIVAGPLTHVMLAFLCFALWLGLVGRPVSTSPLVQEVTPTLSGAPSPAAAAGLRAGDRIVAVDGTQNPTDTQLVRYTQTHVGQLVTIVVERDGRRLSYRMSPVAT